MVKKIDDKREEFVVNVSMRIFVVVSDMAIEFIFSTEQSIKALQCHILFYTTYNTVLFRFVFSFMASPSIMPYFMLWVGLTVVSNF